MGNKTDCSLSFFLSFCLSSASLPVTGWTGREAESHYGNRSKHVCLCKVCVCVTRGPERSLGGDSPASKRHQKYGDEIDRASLRFAVYAQMYREG